MRWLVACAIWLIAGTVGDGQVVVGVPPAGTAVVAIFLTAATDPNVNTPVSAVAYQNTDCRASFVEESPPITNPTMAYWMSAPGSYIECRADITKQVQALSNGTYKAAVKIGAGMFTSFSTTFTKS